MCSISVSSLFLSFGITSFLSTKASFLETAKQIFLPYQKMTCNHGFSELTLHTIKEISFASCPAFCESILNPKRRNGLVVPPVPTPLPWCVIWRYWFISSGCLYFEVKEFGRNKVMYDKTKFIYVGLDLHKEQHTAVIMDCFNEKLGEITIQNKPSEFNKLVNKKRNTVLTENRLFSHWKTLTVMAGHWLHG